MPVVIFNRAKPAPSRRSSSFTEGNRPAERGEGQPTPISALRYDCVRSYRALRLDRAPVFRKQPWSGASCRIRCRMFARAERGHGVLSFFLSRTQGCLLLADSNRSSAEESRIEMPLLCLDRPATAAGSWPPSLRPPHIRIAAACGTPTKAVQADRPRYNDRHRDCIGRHSKIGENTTSAIGTFTKNGNEIPRLAPDPRRQRRAPRHSGREEERDGPRLPPRCGAPVCREVMPGIGLWGLVFCLFRRLLLT